MLPTFLLTMMSLAVVFGLAMLVGSWLNHRQRLKSPRITLAEIDKLQARLDAAALPVVWVSLHLGASLDAAASRVGGLPFADSLRRKWPARGEGRHPMLFLAQINFDEVPPLDGFPRQGLLQLFGRIYDTGDLYQLSASSERVIRWFPNPEGDLTLPLPDSLLQLPKRAPLSQRVIRQGLGMQFTPGIAHADPNNWPHVDAVPDTQRRMPENEEARQRLLAWEKDNENAALPQSDHWIGGHPSFVQNDARHEPRLRKLNRVLLHLSSDNDDIVLCDLGVLNVMISRKDLMNQDFEKAFCTWDFH
jgi:uncharacterized protein YwqG